MKIILLKILLLIGEISSPVEPSTKGENFNCFRYFQSLDYYVATKTMWVRI